MVFVHGRRAKAEMGKWCSRIKAKAKAVYLACVAPLTAQPGLTSEARQYTQCTGTVHLVLLIPGAGTAGLVHRDSIANADVHDLSFLVPGGPGRGVSPLGICQCGAAIR